MTNQSPRKRLPVRPSLEHLKKQAKRKASKDPELTLSNAQHILAKEYGCKNWTELAHMVETMLRGSDQVNGYKNDFELLPKAADNSDIDAIRDVLASGQFTQHDLDLALARAVGRFEERAAIAELLLEHGADPDGQYGSDYGPIMFITGECLNANGLAFLLDAGADVSFEPINTKYGPTSPMGMFLGTYVRGKNEQKHIGIQLLLDHHAVVPTEVTPEILAIHLGDRESLDQMLQSDPELVNKRYPNMPYGNIKLQGTTLLHCAMEFQEGGCIETLLHHGADINAPAMHTTDNEGNQLGGQTPMFHLVNAWGGHAYDLLRHVVEEFGQSIDWHAKGTFQQFDEVKGPLTLHEWLSLNEKELAMVNSMIDV